MLNRLHQVVEVESDLSVPGPLGADFASSARSIERLCLRAERAGPSGWEEVLPQISEHASRFPTDAQAWIYLARAKMALGGRREAYRALQEALALDGNVYLGHSLSVLAAQGCSDMRKWPLAAKHAEAALSCRPGDVDALELLFRAQSELMERSKAQETLQTLRSVNPQRCMSLLTELAYSSHSPVERHRWLSEAVSCARGDASRKLLHDLGEASLVIDRRDEAMSYFEQAFQHPDGPDVDTAKALAQMYVRKDRKKDALEVYRVALQSSPGSLPLIRNYGQLLLKEGRSSEAIGAISRGARLAPANEASALHLLLAELHQGLGQMGEALIAWEAAASLNPESVAAWRGLAAAARSDGQLHLRSLRNLVRLEPGNAEWHAQLGALRLAAGEVVEAEADVDRALKLDPCNGPALELKALLLEKAGKESQALDFVERVARENKSSKEALEVAASFRGKRHEFREAARWYQELEKMDSNYLWPCRLAQAQLHLDDVHEAQSSLQRAGERLRRSEKAIESPNPAAEAEVRTWLGYGLLLQGDVEKAAEKLSQASRVSNQASTHLFQALAFQVLGRDGNSALNVAKHCEPRLREVAHRLLPALPSRLQAHLDRLFDETPAQFGYRSTATPAAPSRVSDYQMGQKVEVYSKSAGRWLPAEIIQAEVETVKVRYGATGDPSKDLQFFEKLLLRSSENLRPVKAQSLGKQGPAEKGIDVDSGASRGKSPRPSPMAPKDLAPRRASVTNKEVVQEAAARDSNNFMLNPEDLQVGKVLGSGGFGAVYRGTFRGEEVAIKKLHLVDGQVSPEQLEEFKKEVCNLQALRHPRLVSFIGCALKIPSLMIVTEYMPNGSLYEALHQRKLKIEHERRHHIAKQVSEGVTFLHSKTPPFVHRDLKSMNVIMDYELNAKLCDFGLTQSMEKTHISRRDNEGGSPRYMAPELFDSKGKITEKVDVWALGCLVVEVISNRLPHEVHAEDTQVLQQLLNKVKLCPNCQKACAHTMHQCNNCCTHLTEDTLAATDNVLMAFVFGIQKGRFPLTISMRACTKEFLVFDDPLCVSVCHLNVIPTKVYIPDLRYLFKDPLRGRKIVHAMLEQVDTVCLEQHWSDEKFRAAYLQAAPGREALRSMGTAGMNFPPSQQQLHLQYVHGPMLPFQYAVFKDGLHLQYKRFFPVQFLLDSLAAGDKVRLDVHENTDIEEIIQMAAVVGVDYDSYWSQMCAQVNTIQESCSPWREADFMYRIVGKNVYDAQTGQELPELNVKAIQAADVKRLQSYSCGATEPGRCCYYPFAKRAAEIESWK